MAPPAILRESGTIDAPHPVYFDRLEPAGPASRATLLLFHGGAHTGTCYLETPDGRPGWAYRFAEAGYQVVVPDWPGHGRSGYLAPEEFSGAVLCQSFGALIEQLPRPLILLTHSMSGAYGWKLLEAHAASIAALVGIAPGPPGNIQPAPTVIAETDDEIELQSLELRFRLSRREPFIADDDFIDRKIIGASRFFPRDRIDAYKRTLLPIPAGLIWERLNVKGMQLRVDDPGLFQSKPIVVVTGTEDIDHPRAADGAIVDWLRDAGAAAEYIYLGDRGIVGNGHMMMLEENNDEIAEIIIDWIGRAVPRES
jgi:pimeloyl-ACP methyl ester carboxylesterase